MLVTTNDPSTPPPTANIVFDVAALDPSLAPLSPQGSTHHHLDKSIQDLGTHSRNSSRKITWQ